MKRSYRYRFAVTGIFVFLLWLPAVATAQPAPIPYHEEQIMIHSGLHDGQVGPGARPIIAFRNVIQFSDAPWLRLYFQEYNLGSRDDVIRAESDTTRLTSFITITSVEDGGQQRFDARSLPQWNNASAYFNGNALEIVLHVAPDDEGIFFLISKIAVGERSNSSGPPIPTVYSLSRNFPNPFNPETTLRYPLPKISDVSLVVYNLMGREIIRWDEDAQPPGNYQKIWNGRNQSGSPVASGVYIYRLIAGDFARTRKMVLLK